MLRVSSSSSVCHENVNIQPGTGACRASSSVFFLWVPLQETLEEMKMSKRQEMEAARRNDIPPERVLGCLRHHRCRCRRRFFGYMTALLAALIQHFLKELAKDRPKRWRIVPLGLQTRAYSVREIPPLLHTTYQHKNTLFLTPTPVSGNDFSGQNCTSPTPSPWNAAAPL